jgi:hypothetical protein
VQFSNLQLQFRARGGIWLLPHTCGILVQLLGDKPTVSLAPVANGLLKERLEIFR